MEGDTISVTWGHETFFPKQYNGFTIGPFTIETTIRKGETHAEAFARLHEQLEAMAASVFKVRRDNYIERYNARK